MIEVRSLHKAFQSLNAVDDLSFQIRNQETFGLLGPNGAGKTTTISMITGVLKPDSGSIAIDGIDDPSVADARRSIGIAPQELALYDNLTAEENLTFFARLYGLSNRVLRERVDWALEFAGLTDRRRGRVHTFSGGMQRRLNIAAGGGTGEIRFLLTEPLCLSLRAKIYKIIENI